MFALSSTDEQPAKELESSRNSESTNAEDKSTDELDGACVTESPVLKDQLMQELEDLHNDIQPYISSIFIKPEVIEETRKELIADGMSPEETSRLCSTSSLRKYQQKNMPKGNYSEEERKEIERLVKRADELLEKFAQIGEVVTDSEESLLMIPDREQ